MPKKEATEKELRELWEAASAYWDKMDGNLDLPWVEAKFKLSIFKTTIGQRGLRIPINLSIL